MTTEPKRLLEESGEGFDRSVLESGMDDAPPPKSMEKTLAALGLGTAVVATTAAVGTGAVATGAKGIGAMGQLVAALVVSAGVVGGGVYLARRPATPAQAPAFVDTSSGVNPSSTVVSIPSKSEGTSAVVVETSEPAAPPTVVASAKPVVSARATVSPEPGAKPAASTPVAPATEPSGDGLAAEVALIDQARQAMLAGDHETCRARAQSYKARYPKGQFAGDADAMRASCSKK
jgi:hypothetical protein